MESPHQIFFKLHSYYQIINKIKGFSSLISSKFEIPNLLLYNFVKSPLYNHYLVFTQPPLTDVFSNKDLQDLALRFAQLHVTCADKCQQNGYILSDRFDAAALPQLDVFFNHSLQMLNTSLGNIDFLRSDQSYPLIKDFFTLVAQEYQFIENFCKFLQLDIADYSSMIHRFSDQILALSKGGVGIDERGMILFELFQTTIFIGVPFIVGYESFAWIPRSLADLFQFEKSLIEEYIQTINSKISPSETMPLGTWFNENQTAMVQNPPYNDGLSLIDIIFIQAITSASDLYNYSQLGQYATYLQSQFEIEIGTATIIIGKFYNSEINQWIEAQNFRSGSELLSLGHTPLKQIKTEAKDEHGIESPSLPFDEPPADIIFAETAGDFNSAPKLNEIERILNIIKGNFK